MIISVQVMHDNAVPLVIEALEEWVRTKRTQTYIPPAFFERDGSFFQPPSFEMPAFTVKKPNNWLETEEAKENKKRILI